MKIISLLFILASCGASESVLTHYSYAHGHRYENTISIDRFYAMPAWNPDLHTPIPIDAASAYRSALNEFNKITKEYVDDWTLQSINVIPVHPVLHRDKWIYEISFQHTPKIHTGPGSCINIIVPMDGIALSPAVVDWDMKNNKLLNK